MLQGRCPVVLTSPTPGSTADIQQRLVKWCLGTERGLARVEYFADSYRQAVIAHLKTQLSDQNIPFYQIKLPDHTEAAQVLYFLREQLEHYTSGVVSIVGFHTAFTPEDQQEGLSGLNFNRELWANFPLRQIWWFTPGFSHLSQEEMPDLNSWFILRLRLLESLPQAFIPAEEIQLTSLSTSKATDTKRRTDYLLMRFNQAKQKNADPLSTLKLFGLPALQGLLNSGDYTEGRRFNQQLESQLNAVLTAKETSLLIIWAEIYKQFSEFEKAKGLYQHLIQIFDEFIQIDSDDVDAHYNKGNVLRSLGDLQTDLEQISEALASYQAAINSFDRALQLAPDHLVILRNQGKTCERLGSLLEKNGDQAIAQYQLAIAAYNHLLELVPSDQTIRQRRDGLAILIH